MIGTVSIKHLAHDPLFSKTKAPINMPRSIIGHEDIQEKPVCAILVERALRNLVQKLAAYALIRSTDDNALQFHGSVFRLQLLQNCEGGDVALLVFCHDVDRIGLGQHFQVPLFRPGANQGAVLGLCLQPENFRYILRGRVAEPHGERLP